MSRHDLLIQMREDVGLRQSQAAALIGIPASRLCAYEGRRAEPVGASGVKPTAKAIAAFYGVSVDFLWPEEARGLAAYASYAPDAPLSPLELLEMAEWRQALDAALALLPPRELRIIRWRFGLDGHRLTLSAVGKCLGLSTERVRCIEATALRRLRHPHGPVGRYWLDVRKAGG